MIQKKIQKYSFIYKAKFTFCIFLLKFIIEKNEIKNLSKSISEKNLEPNSLFKFFQLNLSLKKIKK
jgi:hypothetical protein